MDARNLDHKTLTELRKRGVGVTLHNNLNESLVYLSECFV